MVGWGLGGWLGGGWVDACRDPVWLGKEEKWKFQKPGRFRVYAERNKVTR